MPQPKKNFTRREYWLLIALALFIPLVFVGAAVLRILSNRQYASSTKGTVLASKIEKVKWAKSGRNYQAIIIYQYVVDGKSYQNDAYSPFYQGGRGSKETADEILSQFRPRTLCTVYFNPSNPQLSVLNKGQWNGFWWAVLLCLLPSIFLIWAVRIQMKKSSQSESNPPSESGPISDDPS